MVNDHHDFWLLMYIDVLEFENLHFRKMFEGLVHNLRRRFAKQFAELKSCGAVHGDIDPAVGFTALYMQFFNYFLVEKLFGGNHHFGLTDEQVIKQLTDMYCRGLLQNQTVVRLNLPNPLRVAKSAKLKRSDFVLFAILQCKEKRTFVVFAIVSDHPRRWLQTCRRKVMHKSFSVFSLSFCARCPVRLHRVAPDS